MTLMNQKNAKKRRNILSVREFDVTLQPNRH